MNLLAHYLMNDNAASTPVLDASYNARNGTCARNTNLMSAAGKINNALTFNGSTDKVNCNSEFIGTTALTICAWVSLSGWGGSGLGRIADNGKVVFFVSQSTDNTGRLNFTSNGGSTTARSSGVTLVNAGWLHVIVTRDAAGVTNFYINNVITGTADQASGTPASGTTNVILGNNNAAARGANGLIDDVRFYDKVLSSDERALVYNSGTGIEGPAYTFDVDYDSGHGNPSGCWPELIDETITLAPHKVLIADYTNSQWCQIDVKITGINGKTPIFYLALADSAYSTGTIEPMFSYDRVTWTAFATPANDGTTATWYHSSAFTENVVYVALMRPTTAADVQAWVTANLANPRVSSTLSADASCELGDEAGGTTDQGRVVPALPRYGIKFSIGGTDKPVCVIHAINHASESLVPGCLLATMNWLISGDPAAAYLLSLADVYVYISNLSGLYGGLHRNSLDDSVTPPYPDRNRQWKVEGTTASVQSMMTIITADVAGKTLAAFVDCHNLGNFVTYWSWVSAQYTATWLPTLVAKVRMHRLLAESGATIFSGSSGVSAGVAAYWAKNTVGFADTWSQEVGPSRLYAPIVANTPAIIGACLMPSVLANISTFNRSAWARHILANYSASLTFLSEASTDSYMVDLSGDSVLFGPADVVGCSSPARPVDAALVPGIPLLSAMPDPLYSYRNDSGTLIPTSGNLTVIVIAQGDVQAASTNLCYLWACATSGSEADRKVFWLDASGNPQLRVNSTTVVAVDATKDYRGQPYVWCVVRDSVAGTWAVYANGALLSSTSSADDCGAYRVHLGGYNAASRYVRIAGAAVLGAALTAAQVKALSATPWQTDYYRPIMARIRTGG